MKKSASTIVLLLILSSMLLTLSYMTQITVRGAEHVFFEDDFESYDVGTFPFSGRWDLWFDGAGISYQIIVDSVADSPTKSLQLRGASSQNPVSTSSSANFQFINFMPPGGSGGGGWDWGASAAWPLETELPQIGFNVSVRVEETGVGVGSRDNARVAFGKNVGGGNARHWAAISFRDNGTIASGGQSLQSYVTDRWYKVMSIMDRSSETYSVWVDGVLVGENLTVTSNHVSVGYYPPSEIEAFTVGQFYNGVKAYFDDVKVFAVFDLDPKLELVPANGIAATTLVGSGFAPNSEITVTWDGTSIPTVPSPLISNSYGDFTAIISVLNQTTAGTYTVKAIDEIGTEANATFTVYSNTSPTSPLSSGTPIEEQQNQNEEIPEFPSWIILPLFLIATLVAAIIRRKVFRPI